MPPIVPDLRGTAAWNPAARNASPVIGGAAAYRPQPPPGVNISRSGDSASTFPRL